jgi:hypothetical protein
VSQAIAVARPRARPADSTCSWRSTITPGSASRACTPTRPQPARPPSSPSSSASMKATASAWSGCSQTTAHAGPPPLWWTAVG